MRHDDPRLAGPVEAASGRRPRHVATLTGGCIAQVYKVELEGGGAMVAKVAPEGGLSEEAAMLADLARLSDLPLPAVFHASDDLLLLDFVDGGTRIDAEAEAHAAELLAALHGISAPACGYGRDTLIGPLRQPNPWTESWLDFFREQRLLYLGRMAAESGQLPADTMGRLERFCGRLERYIDAPAAPSLIHGDLWGGNILARGGRITAFLDPAIYYAHAEIELAYSTLFGTFGQAFFERYQQRRPIAPGFFEARRHIYNLYPLLVHTQLFGGHYAASVDGILRRYG